MRRVARVGSLCYTEALIGTNSSIETGNHSLGGEWFLFTWGRATEAVTRGKVGGISGII